MVEREVNGNQLVFVLQLVKQQLKIDKKTIKEQISNYEWV